MIELAEIERSIEALLNTPLYCCSPEQKRAGLLPLLKAELTYACDRNRHFRNYVEHWPADFRTAHNIADLPFVPSGIFKADPPVALIEAREIVRTLRSSATSSQTPAKVVLDRATARRMSKSLTFVIRDFIGSERRPYLVIDTQANLVSQAELGARGAAIQGLTAFATEIVSCLNVNGHSEPVLDVEKLENFAAKWREKEILVYGFTYVIWTCFVQPLLRVGKTLKMPNVRVLHSGGWKRLEREAVTKKDFNRGLAEVLGCSSDRVTDFYGMVENVGVVYPDCSFGNKHVPAFSEIVVRDELTLLPVEAGQRGLVQVCSVLPTSFPGFLILTDDVAELISYDGCPCGRRGTCFRFVGRVPKVEVRGCGNIDPAHHGGLMSSYA